MKKFIMTFLVASMVIATGLSLSSCKKTDTNASADKEEWVPVVYDFIALDENQGNTRQGDPQIPCTYSGAPIYCNQPLERCNHEISFANYALYCDVHSHVHCFGPTDDCNAPNQITTCEYRFHRKHYHIITYHINFYHHSWHVGGGCLPF